MKRLSMFLIAAIMGISFVFAGSTLVAEAAPANSVGQVVPTTKKVTKKSYKKGRWVTTTSYRHGKKITKKTWKKGNHYGHKTAGKTKEIFMGPKTRKP